MPSLGPVPFLISRLVGAIRLIDARAARGTPEEACLVSDAEMNDARSPACEGDVAPRLGAEAA